MTLIIYPEVDIWQYVLAGIAHREDVLLFPLRSHCSLWQHAIRKIDIACSIPASLLLGATLRNAITSLSSGDRLILCEYTSRSLCSAVHQLVQPAVSCHLWLWNRQDISDTASRNLSYIQDLGFKIATYDERDALQYNLRWHQQFFCINYLKTTSLRTADCVYDFFFTGYQKNRKTEIDNVQLLLKEYRCRFHVVHSNADYIPYTHYLQLAAKSRCIVEIIHPGDNSCTLRPLEALALGRKLLTNNADVRQFSFYHPQNIFILGVDSLSDLPQFLSAPLSALPSSVVDSYDISDWLDSFR